MKPLKPFHQSAGMAGPASLKMLLSHYGKDLSEQELIATCGATAEAGTAHDGLIKAVTSVGAIGSGKADATLDDLRVHVENDIPVLVGWTSRDEDHYSVVYEVGKAKVYLMDPAAQSGIRILPIEEFEANWHDHGGPGRSMVHRWMMTVAGL